RGCAHAMQRRYPNFDRAVCAVAVRLGVGTHGTERKRCGNRSRYRLWRWPMPNSLQSPLERQRDLQRRWGRLLQRTTAPTRASVNEQSALRLGPDRAALLVDTMPPRDPNDDDDIEDDEEEEAEDREPAVIREPDGDE